jgi:hypothetical protein
MRRLSGMSCGIIMRITWVRLRSIQLLDMVGMKMSIMLRLRRVMIAMGRGRSIGKDILFELLRRTVGFGKGMRMLRVLAKAVQRIARPIRKSNSLKRAPSRRLDAVVTALMMGMLY